MTSSPATSTSRGFGTFAPQLNRGSQETHAERRAHFRRVQGLTPRSGRAHQHAHYEQHDAPDHPDAYPTPNSKKQSKYATSNVCHVQAQLQQHNSKSKSSTLHTACRSRSLASRPSPCPPASLGHLHLQHRDDHVQQHALPPPKRLFLLCHRESRPLRLCFY